MTRELLPDSRAREPKDVIRGPGGNWVPIFCGSCGAPGGRVPEENMTFAYWLCGECAKTWGLQANEMAMPDEIFWERVKQEQLSTYDRLLTQAELIAVVEADASPLATLLKRR